jgi:GT2 family glycosyltransferase
MVLSIIIVNYNVKYFLEKCLRSVEKATRQIESEIIVIDNASTDDSISYLSRRFPAVLFSANKINVGFGKANNQGLQNASGEYILFLNPDTILPENALEKCIGFFKDHPDAGACGVRMIDGSGKYLPESKRGFPSLSTAFFKLTGITAKFPSSKRFARYYLGHLSEKETNEVDVLAGAFLMVRKEVLQVTGGFDEAFFMYGEDIDLSYRIQKAGWKNYFFPGTAIIHFKGESTKKGDLDYVHMFYKAMSIFVKKHYGSRGAGLFPFFIQLAISVRAVPTAVKALINIKRAHPKDRVIETVVICKNAEGEAIRAILGNHKPARNFHLFSALPPAAVLRESDEVVFSESVISYKMVIDTMQMLTTQLVYRFYDPCSKVIIGSDSKNKSGIVIV